MGWMKNKKRKCGRHFKTMSWRSNVELFAYNEVDFFEEEYRLREEDKVSLGDSDTDEEFDVDMSGIGRHDTWYYILWFFAFKA